MSAVLKAQEPSTRYLAAMRPSLVEHFDLVASAPGGVARLRELIFDIAAAGKLISPSDNLEAVKLDSVAEFIMGQAPPGSECNKEGRGTIFVKTGEFGALYPDTCEWTTKPLKLARRGDVLICVVGATIGKLNLAIDCAIGRSVAAIRPSEGLDTTYLYYMLMPFTIALRRASRGSAQGVIGKAELSAVRIRVPSIVEQTHIVARVEELMRLCDALEAQGRLEGAQHAQLLDTLLGTLTDSASPEDLAANWQRVAAHFDLLLDRPEAIDALDRTVLDLAVRGSLVSQHTSDEPAAALLRRMQTERLRLVSAGKRTREAPATAVAPVEGPFKLPQGWEWACFDQLIDPTKPISYGVLVPGSEVADGVPFVRIADLSIASPAAKPEKKISPAVDAQYQRTRLVGGEILMGVVGSIGKLGVAPQSWAGANIARAICRIVPAPPIDREFMLLLLESEFMQRNFAGDTRTLAQPTLNVGLIRAAPTPVPPLAEQHRIVARVNQLRRLCADLRAKLASAQATQVRLADTLVESAASAD